MANELHIDFETRSAIDLLAVGLYVYARHPTTSAWCMSYAFDDGEVGLWAPGEQMPFEIIDHIDNNGKVVAHNATFEIDIWNQVMPRSYDLPELKAEQCECTMAMAYAMGLPGSLEKAGAAVGLDDAKDMQGSRLMKQMSKPRSILADGTIVWWDQPDKLERLYAYCMQDTVVERELQRRLVSLSKAETRVWQLDQKINNRGVPVDVPTIKNALELVSYGTERLDEKLDRLTNGYVSAVTNTGQLDDWLNARIKKRKGVAKDVLKEVMDRDDLDPLVREVIQIRQDAGKTSNAKMDRMLEGAELDGRVYGTLQYHGAATGRWAGRKLQTHNFPRPEFKPDQIEDILEIVNADTDLDYKVQMLEMMYGPVLNCLSSSLRGLIAAPEGKEFCTADFANIEGRKLAWLVGESWKLQAFREFDAGIGPDLYLVAAGRTFGKAPEDCKSERQIGKVEELALGYQGGVGAFQQMAKGYGLLIGEHYETVWESVSEAVRVSVLQGWKTRGVRSGTEEYTWKAAEAIKVAWRNAHPATVQYWYDIEEAAIRAVVDEGNVYSAGAPGRQIKFKVSGSFLWAQLPSKRVLCYPYPRLKPKKMPWTDDTGEPVYKDALFYKTVDGLTKKWVETSTYGGKLTENVTQASARDILVESMFKVERAGFPVVMHVHDEIVAEVDAGVDKLSEMEQIMSQVPAWAEGLPIAVEGWQGRRYRK